MPRCIGITGSIGSGKSTVGEILISQGIPVIDTDRIVHELLSGETATKKAVLERFGASILTSTPDGAIDRARLGSIVFSDARARKDLEAIIHPAVLLEVRKRVKTLSAESVVAVLVPLLFEAGIASEFDEVWTVVAQEPVLRQRLRQRDDLSENEIAKRLSAQMPQQQKASKSHRIIDNSGSRENTRRQIETLIAQQRTKP